MAGHTRSTTTGLVRVQNAQRRLWALEQKYNRTGWLSTADLARRANALAIVQGRA